MNNTQTNVLRGPIVRPASETLTDLEGRLVMIVNDSGASKLALPNAIGDYAFLLLTDGAAIGENAVAIPLDPTQEARIRLNGTCVPGDVLVLAAINGTTDGMVRKLPTATGTYRGLAIAQETGADTQLVLARPAPIGNIVVP